MSEPIFPKCAMVAEIPYVDLLCLMDGSIQCEDYPQYDQVYTLDDEHQMEFVLVWGENLEFTHMQGEIPGRYWARYRGEGEAIIIYRNGEELHFPFQDYLLIHLFYDYSKH